MELELASPTDPVLNAVAKEVICDGRSSGEIKQVIARMYQMAQSRDHSEADTRQVLGLAAPQIGVSKRIIMIDMASTGMNDEQDLRIFINPRITHRSPETVQGREGCWSTGNICANVERAREVELEALDPDGKLVKLRLTGFTARIAQHEVDHLAGIRFPDRVEDDEKLHWVEPKEFDSYRVRWQEWPVKCPRATWVKMKTGQN